jgi:hypothetical protein
MGTNTAGHLLIADGTNFNAVAATSLSEISTIANDDVFLAVDTSGGGLKKVARSTVVSGLATSSALSNVVEDTTPQLGGNLDMNGADIVTTSNATIDLAPNGTGTVVVRGNTNSGRIVYNCESNSHGQTLASQPHSAAVTNTMLLPAGANSTLVSLVSTDTLTNKTLTSPKINEDVALTSTATELNLLDGVSGLVQADLTKLAAIDSTAAELNIIDGGTSATSTTVADADRVVLNDNGTMVQVAVTDLAAYFDDEITSMPNLVTTAATTVGALNSGSITSGFGTIDTGSSTITTTGLISGGSLDIDNVLINGTTIGHTDDTDLMTVADGLLTVAGEVSMTTLDIGGTNVSSTAAELNILDAVARGKIIYGNSSGATALLSPGTNGQVLTSDGTDISWATSSGIGMGKAIAAALVFG